MAHETKAPSTIITLTLPTPMNGGIPEAERTATLLIQRGDLAHIRQFHYTGYLPDVMEAIREATEALGQVEDHPPVIPEADITPAKAAKTAAKTVSSKPEAKEPTIAVPLKKGSVEVKISHLKIIGGETDAAAYRQAVAIAGRLIDGKLWDGESPIRIDDVYMVAKRLKHLSDKELSLFALDDFVHVGNVAQRPSDADEIDTQDDLVEADSDHSDKLI